MSSQILCHAFKCIFLFFSIVLPVSLFEVYDFSENKYLEDLCNSLGERLPKKNEECEMLLTDIALRYFGGKMKDARDLLLEEVWGNKITPNCEIDWKALFRSIKKKYEDLEPLLKVTKLKNVPQSNAEWLVVKIFIDKLKCVNIELKSRMDSIFKKYVDSRKDDSKTNYLSDFTEISTIYLGILSDNRREMLSSCGFTREPLDYKDAFNSLMGNFLALVELCKHLACGLKLRDACHQFNDFYYRGSSDTIEQFDNIAAGRYTNLFEVVRCLAKLTTKSKSEAGETFKAKWLSEWIEMIKIDAELFISMETTTSAQKSQDSKETNSDLKTTINTEEFKNLKNALLRIWNAKNYTDALSMWEKDRSTWSARVNKLSTTDLYLISVASKPKSDYLRASEITIPKKHKVVGIDVVYASALYESTHRNSQRYKKCLWVLIYSRDHSIVKMKNDLKKKWNNILDDVSRYDLFCSKLVIVWSAVSNSDFLGADLKNLPSTCTPVEQDYEKYVQTFSLYHDLHSDVDHDTTKDVIWSIMHFTRNPPSTTTVKP